MRPDHVTTDVQGASRYERDRALDEGDYDEPPTVAELRADEEVDGR